MENKKMQKWQKILLGLGCVATVGLSTLGLSFFVGTEMAIVYVMAGSACICTGASIALVIRDIIKNISYEYVDECDEYEEYEDDEEYEDTVRDEHCLRLVKSEDIALQGRYSYKYNVNNPPELKVISSSKEYVKKREK